MSDISYWIITIIKMVIHPSNIPYRLGTRPHNMTMINKTKFLNDTDFIIHVLYKYSY